MNKKCLFNQILFDKVKLKIHSLQTANTNWTVPNQEGSSYK